MRRGASIDQGTFQRIVMFQKRLTDLELRMGISGLEAARSGRAGKLSSLSRSDPDQQIEPRSHAGET
jgi:hypothetical protein